MPAVADTNFLAMSMYLYAVDCMRALAPSGTSEQETLVAQWPKPTLAELAAAAQPWCATKWAAVQAGPSHPQTPSEKLPHRCFDINYVIALLETGFGAFCCSCGY